MATKTLRVPIREPLNGASGHIEQSLRSVAGVHSAEVGPGEFTVTYDSVLSDPSRLIDMARNAGANPAVRTARFVVTGMHCSSCAIAIERALLRQPGVAAAELTFATEKVSVIYDPRTSSPRQFRKIIDSVGFGTLAEGDAAARESAHVRDFQTQRRRLGYAALLGGPILIHMVLSWFHLVPSQRLLLFAFATPLQLVIGWHYYRASYQALRYAHVATSDVLIAVGSTAAYLYSVATTFWIAGPVYYDTQAMVLVFVLIGKFLKVAATSKSTEAVRALVGIQARTACIVNPENGRVREVPIDEVSVGTTILVREGERAALDGSVAAGDASFDESMLTGESMPLEKQAGDPIIAGSVAVRGSVQVRVERVGADTTLAQIIRLVESAQGGKIAVMDLADRISYVFVPVVLALAGITYVGWLIHGSGVSVAVAHAVAALIIACPCALSLAPGTAIAVATGEGARRGILIKGGRILEHAHRLDVAVFDKTGTLTKGRPTLTRIVTSGISEERALSIAGALEQYSLHPLAGTISARAVEPAAVTDVEEVRGAGVRGRIGAVAVHVGRISWLHEEGVAMGELGAAASSLSDAGMSVVGLAMAKRLVATFGISDEVKSHARAAVELLKERGLRVVMVTGDHAVTARRVAGNVGIVDVHADVRPDGKAQIVRDMQKCGLRVAFVGDGINDAPALGQADVGIAMGTGTDVAAAASDITLIGDDLRFVAAAIGISRSTFRIITQNFAYAFGFNILALPVAALGFLDPVLAASSMAVSSALVVGNSLRLRGQARRLLENS